MMKTNHILTGLAAFLCAGVMTVSAGTTLEWKGKVINADDNTPVAGARISVNEARSAMTGEDGTFSLVYETEKPSAANKLTVTAPGYVTRVLYEAGSNTLTLALMRIGYESADKDIVMPLGQMTTLSENPYSVTSVKNHSLYQTATSPDEMLQGTVAGLNTIFRSGLPGSGSNMYLHGLGSLNATSQPYIIVDGMPYENYGAASLIDGYQSNPLSAIEVKDVESITVIKDGTALYGPKGANGVILITTIKATEAATKIDAHVHAGVNFEAPSIPLLSASQYKSYLSDLLMTSGKFTASEIQALPYINPEQPTSDDYGRYSGNIDYYRYNQETDWQEMAYKASLNQDYYISVRGGDETALYGLSLGYLLQDGAVDGTSYDRFHARFNSDINVSAKLKARANMSFAYGTRLLQSENEISNSNLIYNSLVKAPFTAPYLYSQDGSRSPNLEDADVFGMTNVQSTLLNSTMRNLNYRFLGSLGLNYQLAKNWSLDGMFGMHFNKDRERLYFPAAGYQHESLSSSDVDNKMQHRVERWFILYGDLHAAYSKKLSFDSSISANVGLRYQNTKFENDNGYAFNSASDAFQSLNYGESSLRDAKGFNHSWTWFGVYANVDYKLLNKYFFSAVLSSDYSSLYGEDLGFGGMKLFPSLTAAWLLSGEGFMAGADKVDLLKLRLSAGLSGNDDLGVNTGRRYYSPSNFLGQYGLVLGGLSDTELQPETVLKYNLGLDLAMFDEKLSLSLDFYHNRVNHMLTMSNAPHWTGFPYYYSNGGSMTNTGLDLDFGYRLIDTKAFKWDLNVLIAGYKNKVTSLDGGNLYTTINGATILTAENQPLNAFYGYQTDGIYQTQAQAEAEGLYLLNGSVPAYFAGGDVRFVNQTGTDKLIDEKDCVVIGDPNPDFFGSIRSNMQMGRWNLAAQFNYSVGNDIYNYVGRTLESMSGYENQTVAALNRWRFDGQQTAMPKAVWGDPMGNSRFSDRWIEDGSYLRLKALTLTYHLPNLFKGSSVFVTGENLLTLTKCKALDPEFGGNANPLYMGVGGFTAPLPRTVYAGIKIGL